MPENKPFVRQRKKVLRRQQFLRISSRKTTPLLISSGLLQWNKISLHPCPHFHIQKQRGGSRHQLVILFFQGRLPRPPSSSADTAILTRRQSKNGKISLHFGNIISPPEKKPIRLEKRWQCTFFGSRENNGVFRYVCSLSFELCREVWKKTLA